MKCGNRFFLEINEGEFWNKSSVAVRNMYAVASDDHLRVTSGLVDGNT